jgi:hypothetical protein
MNCDDDTCHEPPTYGVVLLHPGDGYNIVWSCKGHMPETVHELVACGYTTDELTVVRIIARRRERTLTP